MSNPSFQSGKETLALARGVTEKLIDGLTDAQLVHQPDGKCNHILWNIGHIACTDAYFAAEIGKVNTGFPEAWNSLFGMGSVCQGTAKEYPPASEVKAQMKKQREALLSWFGSLGAAQLAEALPEGLQMFGSTKGQLMQSLAWHEGMHAGQITSCRRAVGLGPTMG